jgi:hypothetical protein
MGAPGRQGMGIIAAKYTDETHQFGSKRNQALYGVQGFCPLSADSRLLSEQLNSQLSNLFPGP